MANKQHLKDLRKNYNLCEINYEYPYSIKESFIPKDLSTNEKIIKSYQCNHTHQISNINTTEHQEKKTKNLDEQTEIIELFFNKSNEDLSIRKGRYRRNYIHNDDNDKKDNTN